MEPKLRGIVTSIISMVGKYTYEKKIETKNKDD